MKLKSMKISSEDRQEMKTAAIAPEAPQYPYGLRLHLDTETLKKLGIENLPELGKEMSVVAIAKVCETSKSESEYGKNKCLGLQITELAVESLSPKKDMAEEIYG